MRPFLFFAMALGLVFNSPFSGHARESRLLAVDWRFSLGDAVDAAKTDFDDGAWQSVSLPHNWGWQDAQAGKKYYRGPGWYRRDLDITLEAGRRYFLRFEAASLVGDVYLDGKFVGEHRGGFGAFCFEITKFLSATGTNVLAVRVDNSKAPDIAPLEGDFSVYGGVYRPVHLIVTGVENISLTDHGSPGVAWLQTSVTATQAVLDVTAQISNGTTNKPRLKLVASVVDADGKIVASSEQKFSPARSETAPYFFRVTVPSPHLWNGRKDPYLYKAVVELCSADDVVLDTVEQPLGLRSYYIDPDKGFFLNGRPYHLHGVNRHQDYMDKGWAISETNMDEDIALLKELGATVVRCCHYQHSDYFYSLCDKAGILVWAELPQVNLIRNTPEFENTSRSGSGVIWILRLPAYLLSAVWHEIRQCGYKNLIICYFAGIVGGGFVPTLIYSAFCEDRNLPYIGGNSLDSTPQPFKKSFNAVAAAMFENSFVEINTPSSAPRPCSITNPTSLSTFHPEPAKTALNGRAKPIDSQSFIIALTSALVPAYFFSNETPCSTCPGVNPLGFMISSSWSAFARNCSDSLFNSATLFSNLTPSRTECPKAKSSIKTPIATIPIYFDSIAWREAFSNFLGPAGRWCNHHSPKQPIATSTAAAISNEIQNQNEVKKTKADAIRQIVATIPEIIFGILLFVAICIFWINWFSDDHKK